MQQNLFFVDHIVEDGVDKQGEYGAKQQAAGQCTHAGDGAQGKQIQRVAADGVGALADQAGAFMTAQVQHAPAAAQDGNQGQSQTGHAGELKDQRVDRPGGGEERQNHDHQATKHPQAAATLYLNAGQMFPGLCNRGAFAMGG